VGKIKRLDDKYVNGYKKQKVSYKSYKGKRKETLFFIHGLTSHTDMWEGIISKWIDKGYNIILYGIRGHDKSTKPRYYKDYSFSACADDIVEIMQKENIKKSIFIGQCLGAYIIFEFYRKYKDKVAGIISFGGNYKNVHENFFAADISLLKKPIRILFKSIAKLTKNVDYKLEPLSYKRCKGMVENYMYLQATIRTIPRVWASFNYYMNNCDYTKIIEKINVPFLVLVGEKDNTFPVRISKEMYILNNRNKKRKMVVIKNHGHSVFMKHPGLVNKAINIFLQEYFNDSPKDSRQ